MSRDRMQKQRFEQKYMLNEEQAELIRPEIAAHLDLDENGAGQPNFSYPVHSLYLDSPSLYTFWTTINGDKNRFKLRMRFYDDRPNTPVFFEIKRRVNNCILKQRGGVKKEAVARLLRGHYPGPDDLVSKDPRALLAVQNFVQLVDSIRAVPMAHVCYLREAYVDPVSDNTRVTFDRDVLTEPRETPTFGTTMVDPSRPFGNRVILELKFTDRFPNWLRLLVERFGLMQCGAAKYAEGIAGLPKFGVSHAGDFREAPRAAGVVNPDRHMVAQSFA
jgi:hypothetical protein